MRWRRRLWIRSKSLAIAMKLTHPSLRKISEAYFEIAKKTLTKDGHHTHICILISDRSVVPFPLSEFGEDDKQKVMAKVAERANSMRAYAAVFVTEVWVAGYDLANPAAAASESPTRTESLFLSAISETGDEFYISAPFSKRDGAIVIGATIQRDSSSVGSPMLEPLRTMWKLKRHNN